MSAIIIGAVGGLVCSIACSLKPKFGYDDSLDVVGVHGVGGTWGALATGLFASKAINPAGNDGLFFGNPGQLWTQLEGVLVTIIFSMAVTWILLSILKATMGLRVADDEERMGLDLTQHNERAYE
jgi:Amt family ammonium transporter